MKRVALLSALIITQGCNSSDDTAPYMSTDSTFNCRDVNLSQFHNDTGKALRMIDTGLGQLKSAYNEETAIQTFFREAATKNATYLLLLRQKAIEACAANPELSVSHALTDGLNALYKESFEDMRIATCRSFGKEFDNEIILQEMQNPSKQLPYGDEAAISVKHVLDDKRYGAAYFETEVHAYCEENPNERIWSAYSAVARPALNIISSEQQAAHQLKKEQDAAEEKRLSEELHQANLRKYGKDLYQSGTPDCDDFIALHELSIFAENDRSIFQSALNATTNSIPKPSIPHQREAFQHVLKSNYEHTVRTIASNCSSSIEQAILTIPAVMDSESNIMSELISLSQEHRWGTEGKAAELALKHAKECAQGAKDQNLVCPNNAQDFFNYSLAALQIKELEQKLNKLEAQRQNKPSDFELSSYGKDCKQRLLNQGLRDKQYDDAVQEKCIPEAFTEYFSPLNKEIESVTEDISQANNYIMSIETKFKN
ncbi:hypothetical protein NAV33_04035 [Pseudomonas stutzeri]|uniref:hypothetical protein n=1 Tax=Stutzerimonas stutzeri TaxID=316 RepID=UPI00210D006E|nr:hypothetical protein [Stutzerimonas stutzeri]MCQ4311066.1 hypothetical protein [Stutzerimonas stutzeri]